MTPAWRRCGLGVALTSLVLARDLPGQWSAAPTLALGVAIPASLHEELGEGIVGKAGVWIRAPRLPVGLTAEAVLSHQRAGRGRLGGDPLTIGGLLLNATTRRHDQRLETYAVAGGGWYWYSHTPGRFTGSSAPGFNVGVGELLDVRGHDLFAELRGHFVHTATPTGTRWTVFVPIMIGARF